MQFHTWTADNTVILSGWRYAYVSISKINAIIYQIESSGLTEDGKAKVEAELKGLRAYYYSLLLNWFGEVPISTDFTKSELPKKSTRQEVFNFIEKELKDVLPLLPEGVQYSRFTQNVAYAVLARLYINAEVYTGTPHWQDCISACEKITGFTLAGDYFTNFKIENQT